MKTLVILWVSRTAEKLVAKLSCKNKKNHQVGENNNNQAKFPELKKENLEVLFTIGTADPSYPLDCHLQQGL